MDGNDEPALAEPPAAAAGAAAPGAALPGAVAGAGAEVAGAAGAALLGPVGGEAGAESVGPLGDTGDGAPSEPGEEAPGVPTLLGLTLENGAAPRLSEEELPVLGALPPPPPPINAVEKPVPESMTCGIWPPPGSVGLVTIGFVSVGANAR